jgi:molybdate transport system regulatory protein
MNKDAEPVVKIFFASPGGHGEPFCGPGMIKLLEQINETGNVRRACEQMNMSYSKGWKLLSKLEVWLGYPVSVRQQGGKGGGEAHLTQEGIDFLEKYNAFTAECEASVKNIFNRTYAQ